MKNSTAIPRPPEGLSKTACAWWRKLNAEFEFESSDSLLILESAMQSFDRWQEARAILDLDGIVIVDRFGQKKQHPATLIERDAKLAMLRGLRQLGLDIEVPGSRKIGRPPGR